VFQINMWRTYVGNILMTNEPSKSVVYESFGSMLRALLAWPPTEFGKEYIML